MKTTSIIRIQQLRILAGLLVLLFLAPWISLAQSSLTLSVTPPLFRLNIEKGETWSSSIRIINNNPYDLTVYPTVVNFVSEGEGGYGKFIPMLEGDRKNGDLLANWVTLDNEFVFVPKEQSANISFTVRVPANASPGGHYAAILIGSKPPAPTSGGAAVGVSSYVTSLLLVKVGGEVIERGAIREFSTDKSFYDKQEISLNLRVENTGNVHIIPRGDITIYNMWGSERGKIYINKDSDFGNVLPESIRKFNFTWKGNGDKFEIGRYKAVLTLGFGTENTQTISSTIGFWVVPLKPTLAFLGAIAAFILFMTWSIKAYVRRALKTYKKHLPEESAGEESYMPADIDREAMNVFAEPIREGIIDLRRSFNSGGKTKKRVPMFAFVSRYRKAVIFIIVGAISVISVAVYLVEVRSPAKNYSVSVDREESSPAIPKIKLVSSNTEESDLEIKKLLEKNGIAVDTLEKVTDKPSNDKIIIRHRSKFKIQAVHIDRILGSSSVIEESDLGDADITIIIPGDINTEPEPAISEP